MNEQFVKSGNTLKSPPKHSEVGPEMAKSISDLLSMIQEVPTYTTFKAWLDSSGIKVVPIHPNSLEFFTLVFLAKNKNMTLPDKLNCFRVDSLTGSLFLISDPESITTGKDSPNWWNEFVIERSKKSWLPTRTVSSDSASSSSSKSVDYTGLKSWFGAKITSPIPSTKSLKKTSSALLTSLSPRETASDPQRSGKKEPKPEPNSIKKIRLYPSENQKSKLCQIFDGNRWAYNILVEKTKGRIFDPNVNIKSLKSEVRPLVQKRTFTGPNRVKEIPEEALDSAYRDLWKARTSVLAASKAKKAKTGKGFKCKYFNFRKRKDNTQSIEIRARNINVKIEGGVKFWSKSFGSKDSQLIKVKEVLPPLEYSCRLQRTRSGKYYLCVPQYNPPKKPWKYRIYKSCAIDPGVRTMLTGYDPDGIIFEMGMNQDAVVRRWLLADKIRGKLRKFRGKRNRRYRYKKEQLNILAKINRMVKDCHLKIAKWISTRYDEVLLPKFGVSDMVRKMKRAIGKGTVRRMLGWCHYQFKETLKNKMKQEGGKVIECTEEYTSKTCTSCGRLNHGLGSSKTFKCPYKDCRFQIDRDVGASRNIYLKNCHLLEGKGKIVIGYLGGKLLVERS